MIRTFRKIAGLALVVVAAAGNPAKGTEPAQTVILVRHAERAGGMGEDVGLSEEGRCRAGVLARMLADTGIRQIYVSEVARTQQTAQPLADKLKIRPQIIPANDVGALAEKLRTGGPALVVSHSNRLPEIIQKLGGPAVKPIDDAEFDRLFVATLTGPHQATVVSLRYPGCAK